MGQKYALQDLPDSHVSSNYIAISKVKIKEK